jgi:EAL domain-containing protein (putative c-di-GMP-specific phosphodiesterase class I)
MESRINFVSVKQPARRLMRDRNRLANELGEAIAHHDINVHFQPQYDLRTGRACGVEALARWTLHGKSMPPAIFIPVAERCGLINAVGLSVLHQACATYAGWRPQASGLTLSVNLSPRQINETFAELLAQRLTLAGLMPHDLELEVTESALMVNPEQAIRTLERCKEIGVRIALDDFGTGYSSLNYLAQLPIDRLKLDKSFIQRMPDNHKTAAIIRSVLAMGRDLGLTVIAEGIETEQQLDMLQSMGCTQGQGHLMSVALPAEAALKVLQRPWGNHCADSALLQREGGGLHAA